MAARKITREEIDDFIKRFIEKRERSSWRELKCKNKTVLARCESQNKIFFWSIENIMKFKDLSDFLNQKGLELYEKLATASEQNLIKNPVGRILLSGDIKFKLPEMTEKKFCDCIKRANLGLMQAPNSYLHNTQAMVFQNSEQLKNGNGVKLSAIPNTLFPSELDKELGTVNRTLACLCLVQVFSISEILSFDRDIFECSVLSR